MAGVDLSKSEVVIDSAVGPFVVETKTVSGFDIEDFVKSTIESQAIHLQIREAILNADPAFAKNRTPVTAGDLAIGGYDG